jgi:integrase
MKIDPYKNKEKYIIWKEKVKDLIPGISKENSDIILQFIFDMENGLNVSKASKKGARSYTRLNNLRQRLVFLVKHFEKRFHKSITELTAEEIVTFFNNMRNGTIKREDGKQYQSIIDFINPFKSFWHWHMKVSKQKKIDIQDITEYLDTSSPKPRWVYLTEEQVKRLCEYASPKYKTLMMLMYDAGLRSPIELINLKVSDLYEDCKKLNIRDEIVKKGSFGRKINLMFSSAFVKAYVKNNELQPDDYLFPISPQVANQYLKRLAKRTLGDGVSLAGEKYSQLSLYDFRHCSCCYWLPRYKSESALKYRFGWKKSDKIHYYSELLGMKDTISEGDMLIDLSKTEIENRLLKAEQENKILKEKLEAFGRDVVQLKALMQLYAMKLNQLEGR